MSNYPAVLQRLPSTVAGVPAAAKWDALLTANDR